MDNRKILIDTSVIIDYLRKTNKPKALLWNLRSNYDCFMSTITVFELLAGANTDEKKDDIQKIVKWIEPVSFDKRTAEVAAWFYQDLKKINQGIEFRDIFIAATAYCFNYSLATMNIKHYSRIKEVVLLDTGIF